MKKLRLISAGLAFILVSAFNIHAQSTAPDSIVQLAAQSEGLSLVSAADVPEEGTFWLVMSNGIVPDPAPLFDPSLPIYAITTNGEYLVDDTDGQVATEGGQTVEEALAALADEVTNLIGQIQNPPVSRSLAMRAMDEGGFTPMDGGVSFDTNGLYLQITGVTNGEADVDLFNGTDTVYAVWGTTNLATPLTGWQVMTDVWPTNDTTNTLPFTVNAGDNANLFLIAQDWTGVETNGLPAWWEWYWFDSLDYSATNLDSNGNTLGYDYTNGLDPNVIQFYLQFTTMFLNGNPADGTVSVFGGTPFYEAVLLNDTNTADAVWQPYTTSNVVVTLPTNGAYNILFGLKGLPADASQTWQSAQLTLYSVPLALTITSPANTTVCQPILQLQGYAAKSLDNITFDVSNATGLFTNQTGYVTSRYYDTNLLEFTTNDFECDLSLATGTNAIALHVTDSVSNTVTTNLNIVFDPTTDTNPPLFTLVWPQNDTPVGGSNVTVQAQVSDPTANVSATVNGNTVQGIVEQSGAVWVKDLPLNVGTNTVTLTATNIGGVVNATNFNVVQSGVSLSIDAISSDQLNQTNVTVTGSSSDSSQNVYVNGEAAYYTDGTGDWEADNVPVSGTGTAVVNVSAGADADTPVAEQSLAQPQPPEAVMMGYLDTSHIYDSDNDIIHYGFYGFTYGYENDSVNWFYNVGGNENYMSYSSIAAHEGYMNGFYYETDNFAAGGNDFNPVWEYADLTFDLGYYGPDGDYITLTGPSTTRTRVMIEPAGQSAAGTTSLYLVGISAMEFSTPNQDNYTSGYEGDVPHPPEWTQINGQTLVDSGITNADGSVMGLALVSGTAGIPTDVTPTFTQFVTNADVTFNGTPPVVASFGLTVVSNSATQIDATNWVVIKSPTNDYVYVQAMVGSTNDALLASLATNLQWSGGETVPGNPLQRQISKTNSVETTVSVSLGSVTNSLNVWVVWANLTVKTSGTLDPDDKAQVLDNGNWPTPASINYPITFHGLGGGNGLGPIDCLSNTNLNYAYTVGRMEAKAILEPTGIGNLLSSTNIWDMKRTRIVIAWDNGGSPSFSNPPPGTNDTSGSFFKYLNPTNGEMFDLDAPGCSLTFQGTFILHTAECYDDFYEYVTINLGNGDQICSETNTWSYMAQVDGDASMVRTNVLSTSLITLPTTSYYTHR
jgi:hypothetical protein